MTKLLTHEDLAALGVPQGKCQIWRLERQGKFPKRVYLGRRAAWLEKEIIDWINAKIAERDAKTKAR